jgi:hypothetical protein
MTALDHVGDATRLRVSRHVPISDTARLADQPIRLCGRTGSRTADTVESCIRAGRSRPPTRASSVSERAVRWSPRNASIVGGRP